MPIIILVLILVAVFVFGWFSYLKFVLIGFAILAALKLLSEIVDHVRKSPGGEQPAPSKRGQVEYIRKHLPSSEPLRASLIDVVEEAIALRKVVTRSEGHSFAIENFGATLVPSEFQARSEQAIGIALDLTERFGVIAKSSKGRARSQRTLEAIEAQQEKMVRLKDALEYSRSTIEVLILTKGEGEQTSEKLSRSLRNLSDALEESYDDGFSALEEKSAAPRVGELAPQTETV